MKKNDVLLKENIFSYYIIACKRNETQYSKEELIELLKKEIIDELNYVKSYNVTDEDLLDSISLDVFNSVYSLIKNNENGKSYELALEEKLKLLNNTSYKLIWGDSELLLSRYGILYHIDEKCFYEPYMRLKSIDVDTYNLLWSKEKRQPILFDKIDGVEKADDGDVLLVW